MYNSSGIHDCAPHACACMSSCAVSYSFSLYMLEANSDHATLLYEACIHTHTHTRARTRAHTHNTTCTHPHKRLRMRMRTTVVVHSFIGRACAGSSFGRPATATRLRRGRKTTCARASGCASEAKWEGPGLRPREPA